MTRARHVPDAVLLARSRRPDARFPVSAERHLERCTRCRRWLADLVALGRYLSTAPSEPSAGVVARACALVESRPPQPRDASRFVVARLVYDTGAAPAAQGVRAPVAARQQLWRIPRADLDVRIEPSGLGSPGMLIGQVFPRRGLDSDFRGGAVWLIERSRPPRWASLGAAGEFTLPAPQGRRWSLWVEWGAVRARLELP